MATVFFGRFLGYVAARVITKGTLGHGKTSRSKRSSHGVIGNWVWKNGCGKMELALWRKWWCSSVCLVMGDDTSTVSPWRRLFNWLSSGKFWSKSQFLWLKFNKFALDFEAMNFGTGSTRELSWNIWPWTMTLGNKCQVPYKSESCTVDFSFQDKLH